MEIHGYYGSYQEDVRNDKIDLAIHSNKQTTSEPMHVFREIFDFCMKKEYVLVELHSII